MVERRHPLRQFDRAVVPADEDARAQHHVLGPGRGHAQQFERRHRRPVGVRHRHARSGCVRGRRLQGEEQVLLRPEAGEPERLGPLTEAAHRIAGHVVAELWEREPDAEGLEHVCY